jgi:putative ABC transport system ATP-binding protein
MTALENVDYALRLAGWQGDRGARAAECLALVGLGARGRHMPQELSGGEQQRVAIARALAKNPKLLLCDEPTGALDDTTGKQILHLLQKTSIDSGMTVILITHNTVITEMAQRVISVKNGKIASVHQNDNPKSVDEINW